MTAPATLIKFQAALHKAILSYTGANVPGVSFRGAAGGLNGERSLSVEVDGTLIVYEESIGTADLRIIGAGSDRGVPGVGPQPGGYEMISTDAQGQTVKGRF